MSVFTDVAKALKTKREPDNDLCGWFLLCANQSTGQIFHPVLGKVPTCDRCHRFATSVA